jgi:flagellar hook-associated protein 2
MNVFFHGQGQSLPEVSMVDSVKSTTSTTASAGSSIVSKLSSGSGIDSAALISQLADVSKAAQAARLTTRKTTLETQISDFGLMRSSIAKLDTAAKALNNPDTFNAKSVSIPDTSILGITKLEAKAATGDYKLKVEAVAQSQSLSSGIFTATDTAIGKGTLTIRFGEWNEPPTAFTVDSTKTGGTITIDDSNNSLSGLKDAINAANLGVQASIVGEAGTYKLLVTSASGEKNEIEITATETPGALGLASFNFNNTSRVLTQEQPGIDAQIRVNGLLLTRSSNHITDVIDGLEFDLFNFSASETVTINVTHDRGGAETAIRDFVKAYNTFLDETQKLVGFDEENKKFGSLRQDPLSKSLMNSVRSMLGASVAGLSGNFNTLGSMGIRTQLDGSLQIVEDGTATDFANTIKNNFNAVRDFFVPKKSSDNAQIAVKGSSAKSTPGTYAVNITTNAAKGYLNAGAFDPGTSFPLDTTGKDYSFKIKVNGVESATVVVPTKTYATATELAADLQSLINADTNLKTARASVAVSFNSGSNRFEFVSNDFGNSSQVDITAVGTNSSELGMSIATGTAGVDVAGTVDGVAAFGYGNVLLPAIGSKAEGLSMHISPGAVSGNITYSKGFATSFNELLDNYTRSSGLIKNRETNINKDLEKVKEDEKILDRRTEAYKARLQSQFAAMEAIVRSLKSVGASLDGIVDRLPFTAKNN